MAKLNDDGQWIILMGFIISISILVLAFIVSESALVGKTTSESVLDFSKNDIQDLRSEVLYLKDIGEINNPDLKYDLQNLSLKRKTSIIHIENWSDTSIQTEFIYIHYNNGLTDYNEYYEEYYQ